MLRALADAGRISNLPTVWTNVLVAAALAGWGGEPGPLIYALSTISLFYLGGMFLNDALDADWDREHKRSRPIAQGRLARSTVYRTAFGCLGAALALVLVGPASAKPTAAALAVALFACIVLYNILHKRSVWAVFLMAACRALVYPLAAALIEGGAMLPVWPASGAITVYTLLLTLAARREDEEGARVSNAVAWLVPLPFIIAALMYTPSVTGWVGGIGVLLIAWLARSALAATRGAVPRAVMGWIAGLCLADALILASLDRPALAAAALGAWLLTITSHRLISGT